MKLGEKMGRICSVWEPKYWNIKREGKRKIKEDDIICEMVIGDGDDVWYFEITQLISKSNYQNILDGIYTIKVFPYAEIPILLFDENKKLIPLVRGMTIPFDKFNSIQKQFIDESNNKKLSLKKL